MASRQEVVVIDIIMSFTPMVVFMIKWVIPSVPVFLILSLLFGLFMMLFGGMMRM